MQRVFGSCVTIDVDIDIQKIVYKKRRLMYLWPSPFQNVKFSRDPAASNVRL